MKARIVEKGWGHEEIWAERPGYCGKILHFREGGRCSMHFHAKKDETWRILSGAFTAEMIDGNDASIVTLILNEGDICNIGPYTPHRLICRRQGAVLEVSTADDERDNYRVMPGDSQTLPSWTGM